MSIIADIKKIKNRGEDLKNFGLLVGGIFLGLGLLFLYFSRGTWLVFLIIGGVLFLLGLVAPKVLAPIHKAWMVFGTVMGFIVTNIILTIFFYFIFTPLALILRLSGKHFLNLNFRTGERSYWNLHREETTKGGLEKQF